MKEPFYKKSKTYLLCGLSGVIGALCLVGAVFFDSVVAVVKTESSTVDGVSLMDGVKTGIAELQEGFAFRKITPLIYLIIIFISILVMIVMSIKDNFLNENYRRFLKNEKGRTGGNPSEEKDSEAEENPPKIKKESFLEKRFGYTKVYMFIKKHRHLSRMIPIAAAIVAFVFLYRSNEYRTVYTNTVSLIESWKSIIAQYEFAGVETNMKAYSIIGVGKILMFLGFILHIGAFCLNFILDTLNE